MNRKTRTIWASALAAGCLVVSVSLLPGLLQGGDSRNALPTQKTLPSDKLVVHEWGTFTSFSGSDGVNLDFRPLVTSDLPPFVERPSSWLAKDRVVAQQRMETPVTYFYTDVPRTVNVRVDFPQGLLTEWYPRAKRFDASGQNPLSLGGRAFVDWGPVRLTPPGQFADVRVRLPKGQIAPASLPPVDAGHHYGRARETDSAIVETVDWNHISHFEKFLFYRGVGNFELPIKLVALGGDRFEVTNSGAEASGSLFLMRVDGRRVRFASIESVGPRSTLEVELPSVNSTVYQLADAVTDALVATGLFDKEALAMVNTWRGSWFGENGTRLLYLISSKETDKLLPLSIEPVPDECLRVLVGRLETLTPDDCQRLTNQLVGVVGNRPSAEEVQKHLTSLGRFAEPAVAFIASQTGDTETRTSLDSILAKVRGKTNAR